MSEGAEIDWDGLFDVVVPAVHDALAAGPLTLDQLAEALRRRGTLDRVDVEGWDLEEIVEECLMGDDHTLDFADGRIAIVGNVLSGSNFSPCRIGLNTRK